MKTYRHKCARKHRTYRTFALCAFPRAAWVSGEGQYATLAWCGTLTVQLHNDLEYAQLAIATIDQTGCGSQCHGRHESVQLTLPT